MKRSVTDDEIGLIRAMLARDMKNRDIQFYFNRQDRAVNSGRISGIKHGGYGHVRIEGLPAADWVLVDAGDVVIHLFRPEVRTFYNLERMWNFGDAGAA